MVLSIIGKLFRLLPSIKGKGFLARTFIAPFVKGKRRELIVKMTNPGGGNLICNLDDWIPWNVYIYGRYQIEKKYEIFLLNAARESSIIFDVGANIGYYTVQFCRILKKPGHVYAFEPTSYQFNVLKRNILLNNITRVTCIKAIVSDSDGATKRVYFSGVDNTGGSSVEIKSKEYEDVSTVTIDTFCEKSKIEKIDLMKIDVEGHELRVLRGMERVLKKNIVKNLFVEINNETLSVAGTSSSEIVSYLELFNYKPHSIKSSKMKEYKIGSSESLVYFKKKA